MMARISGTLIAESCWFDKYPEACYNETLIKMTPTISREVVSDGFLDLT
jgi:hypothetical protein